MSRCLFLLIFFASLSLQAATYYVNAANGNDTNPGTSASQPWKSLEAVNGKLLQPGDEIRFARGGVWRGMLAPQGRGEAGKPVIIHAYGTGARPRIEGVEEDAVLLRNFPHVVLRDLEITNRGDGNRPRRGVHIVAENIGTLAGVIVQDLYIHDVNGTNKQKDNGGIIFRTVGDKQPSRFDGLRIERNIVWRVDRSGIAAQSYHRTRHRWFPSVNVVLRDNYVADAGGDGIVPWATDGALVEHNIVRGANTRAGSYNAGIWPWSADHTLFRLNRASEVRTTLDGHGFDSDYNSRGTRFEYNLSHNNEGGFMLICSPGKRNPKENIGNQNTVVRRNISRNDHERIFDVSAAENTLVEENYIYIGAGLDVQLLLLASWEGWADGLLLRNNRYVMQGRARSGHGVSRNEQGSYTLGEGWGGARNVKLEGNQELAKGVDVADWSGPQFDPAHPDNFTAFLAKHRAWMEALMRAHFGEALD
ncbi:MAG: right-handed parallel beta-helix repeat-containing protein [Bryobacterales bacterium]|nr:right-handed parallel beta-helix repeat-containing protein [Bryobacterales bacterium]